jgi:sugar lactone lactonase YvrE
MRGTALSKSVQGTVYGGQQPVSGSTVTLYAASTSGYGTASSSILTSPVTSDANGNFSITNDYTCPTNISGDSLVYIVATGGNSGAGSNNAAIAMMAALGSCATLKANAANTFTTINEITTVASAYALAGFMTSLSSVSSSGTTNANVALQNAFATTNNLANTSVGYALVGVSALGAVSPQAELKTLANALSICINSDGSTVAGHPCAMLFAATTVNSVVPTNTIQAILNIAHNPSQNVATIFNLTSGTPPFAPGLSLAPNDWTIAIVYSGNEISTPQGLAIDASGDVFIANSSNSIGNISASSVGNIASVYSTSASFDAPRSIALSPSAPATLWVANCGTTCSASGNAPSVTATNAVGTTKYTGNGLNASYALAVDGSSNVWISNTFGNSVSELNSAGTAKSGASGYTTGGLNDPITLVLDPSGNAWVANPPANSITKLNSSGAAQSGTSGYTGSGLNYPYAIAIDHSGNAWIANHGANTVVVLNTAGVAQSGTTGYTGAGINSPNAITLDGNGNAWITNANSSVSELTASGVAVSGTTGYTAALQHPNGIAVDGSGNVWISSCGSTCTGGAANSGSVVELVGAAVPVVTPLSLGALNNTLATKP